MATILCECGTMLTEDGLDDFDEGTCRECRSTPAPKLDPGFIILDENGMEADDE